MGTFASSIGNQRLLSFSSVLKHERNREISSPQGPALVKLAFIFYNNIFNGYLATLHPTLDHPFLRG